MAVRAALVGGAIGAVAAPVVRGVVRRVAPGGLGIDPADAVVAQLAPVAGSLRALPPLTGAGVAALRAAAIGGIGHAGPRAVLVAAEAAAVADVVHARQSAHGEAVRHRRTSRA